MLGIMKINAGVFMFQTQKIWVMFFFVCMAVLWFVEPPNFKQPANLVSKILSGLSGGRLWKGAHESLADWGHNMEQCKRFTWCVSTSLWTYSCAIDSKHRISIKKWHKTWSSHHHLWRVGGDIVRGGQHPVRFRVLQWRIVSKDRIFLWDSRIFEKIVHDPLHQRW